MGGGAIGASLAAAALSGRPISGEPGGSAGAAGTCAVAAGAGAAAAGAAGAAAGVGELDGEAGCWPWALSANKPAKALASSMLRDADTNIVIHSSL